MTTKPSSTWHTFLRLLFAFLPTLSIRASDTTVDVVVYGGNAAGVVAAVQTSRMGGTVVVLEPGPAIGGLTTGGLGATDVGDKRAIGGIAHEFYRRLYEYYEQPAAWRSETRAAYVPRHPLNISDSLRLHWFFEPHVAMRLLQEFLSTAKVPVHLNARLDRARGVRKENGRITAITLLDGRVFRGRTFIDATYEGDLMAAAGVSHTIGREPNSRYGETLNGIRFVSEKATAGIDPYVRSGDASSGLLPRVEPRPPGKEGEGHPGVQAYNLRVWLTDVPENRVPFVQPASYRALLPKRAECTNLIVPVCLSASHVAYGSVRMEPVFMMLGQAAATAAMLAQQQNLTLHTLPYETLRARLVADGQVLKALPRVNENRGLKGPASPEAIAAVAKLQHLGFFAAADASVNTWQTAARPGAQVEAARVVALIVAAAQRFDRRVTTLDAALPMLAKNNVSLDARVWQRAGTPEDTFASEAVAPLLVSLAAAFP